MSLIRPERVCGPGVGRNSTWRYPRRRNRHLPDGADHAEFQVRGEICAEAPITPGPPQKKGNRKCRLHPDTNNGEDKRGPHGTQIPVQARRRRALLAPGLAGARRRYEAWRKASLRSTTQCPSHGHADQVPVRNSRTHAEGRSLSQLVTIGTSARESLRRASPNQRVKHQDPNK